MELRDRLLDAIHDETVALDVLESARRNRQDLSELYYREKYGVGKGDIVYSNDERQTEIMISSFQIWSKDPDAKPDVIGHQMLPFGWSKKARVFRSNEWMIPEVEEADGNAKE
jgi:hypothetical protein